MKINWKVRFKNKTFLLTFITMILVFIYNLLGMFGIVPSITQDMATDLIVAAVNILVALGVVTDPTTAGLGDSTRALNYDTPSKE